MSEETPRPAGEPASSFREPLYEFGVCRTQEKTTRVYGDGTNRATYWVSLRGGYEYHHFAGLDRALEFARKKAGKQAVLLRSAGQEVGQTAMAL